MKNVIITILVCIIVAGGIFLVWNYNKQDTKETENVAYGLVTDLKSSDAIEIDIDGNIYNINIANTTIEPDNKNLELDDIIKISYKGELKNNVEVEKITIISETTDKTTTANETTTSSNTSDKEYYITGVIQEISTNNVTIKATNYDNNDYTFSFENALKETDLQNFAAGDRVKIVHKNKLSETNKTYVAVSIKKITEVKKESEKTNTTTTSNTITGEVIYAAGSIIQIKTSDNEEYEFQTVGAKKQFGSEGIHTEEILEITYSGTLSTTEINQATSVVIKGQ